MNIGNWLKKLKEKVIRSQFALEIPLVRRQGIAARKQIIKSNFSDFELPFEDGLIDALVECTENFSGADLKGFAQKVKRKAFASNAKICDRALFLECLSGIYPSSNADLMSNIRKWEYQFNVCLLFVTNVGEPYSPDTVTSFLQIHWNEQRRLYGFPER